MKITVRLTEADGKRIEQLFKDGLLASLGVKTIRRVRRARDQNRKRPYTGVARILPLAKSQQAGYVRYDSVSCIVEDGVIRVGDRVLPRPASEPPPTAAPEHGFPVVNILQDGTPVEQARRKSTCELLFSWFKRGSSDLLYIFPPAPPKRKRETLSN